MIRTIKGTYDILPDQTWRWKELETDLHQTMHRFGYQEIRTPAFESTELFARGIGNETDIVTKEMFTWLDNGRTSLTLKPELTAPVVRAFIQHNLGALAPVTKLYYLDTLFRRERPQKGRQRQFHQFGAEAIGSPYPEQDAELIALAWGIFTGLGLTNLTLKLNSIGSESCRNEYRKALTEYFRPHLKVLSETSLNRFHTNPLRILDTKIPEEIALLTDAPDILNFLTPDDKAHFLELRGLLDSMNIPYEIDKRMVRGLDYYNRTTFEITSSALGSQDALCGGGRYDQLIETLGGKSTPAVGFAAGMERLLLALEEECPADPPPQTDIYFISVGEQSRDFGVTLTNKLRGKGFAVASDLLRRSLKAQLREANKLGARLALVLGDEELKQEQIQIKNFQNGTQTSVAIAALPEFLNQLLKPERSS